MAGFRRALMTKGWIRAQMLDDLVRRHSLIGISRSEILELLGVVDPWDTGDLS